MNKNTWILSDRHVPYVRLTGSIGQGDCLITKIEYLKYNK